MLAEENLPMHRKINVILALAAGLLGGLLSRYIAPTSVLALKRSERKVSFW
jgi:hypothetical protein